MEEKNELNDIILSKGGSNSNSKKLLLAIAALTLILIIVLVIMNSLKSQTDEKPPQAVVPPVPTAPTETAKDPLFEPVEVIQEGSNTTAEATAPSAPQDLGAIAQKIKQESMQNSPVPEHVVQPSAAAPAVAQPSIASQQPKAAPQSAPVPAAAPVKTAEPAKTQPTQKFSQNAVNTPTIKTVKAPEVKKTAAPKAAAQTVKSDTTAKTAEKTTEKPSTEAPKTAAAETPAKAAPKATDTSGTYYIQVGSFTKEPSKALFDRLNASGLKYTTVPSGAATKVLVGPFQGEKAARDVLGNVKRNVEAGAYIVKG